jgi:hypothetical protein
MLVTNFPFVDVVQRALGDVVVGHRVMWWGLSHVLGQVVVDQAEVGMVVLR